MDDINTTNIPTLDDQASNTLQTAGSMNGFAQNLQSNALANMVLGQSLLGDLGAQARMSANPMLAKQMGEHSDKLMQQGISELMQSNSPLNKMQDGMSQIVGGLGMLVGRGSPNAMQNALQMVQMARSQKDAAHETAIKDLSAGIQISKIISNPRLIKTVFNQMNTGTKNAITVTQNAEVNALKAKGLGIKEDYQKGLLKAKNDYNGIQQQHFNDWASNAKAKNAAYVKNIDSLIESRKELAKYHDLIGESTIAKNKAYSDYLGAKTDTDKANALTRLQEVEDKRKNYILRYNLGIKNYNLAGQSISTAVSHGQPTHGVTGQSGQIQPVGFEPSDELPMNENDETEDENVDDNKIQQLLNQAVPQEQTQLQQGIQQQLKPLPPQVAHNLLQQLAQKSKGKSPEEIAKLHSQMIQEASQRGYTFAGQ